MKVGGPNKTKQTGDAGETMAAEYLIRCGHKILERNWRHRKFEIDIISVTGDTIVFTEVKTRKNNTFGEPEIFVTMKKQRFLIAAANHYLISKKIDLEARFDIVGVVTDEGRPGINHLEGAFYPLVK
jgi:putative endonuclease